MVSEVNTKYVGWDFVETLYNFYKNGEKAIDDRKYRAAINKIKRNVYDSEKWLKEVQEKAKINKIPLDSMVTLDAIWMYNQMNK